MSKCAKIWLIIVSSLVVLGCGFFAGVMTMLDWDFTKLSTVKYETNEHQIEKDYKSISVITDTADIVFVPSTNMETSVVCREQNNMKHSVTVQDDTLVIEVTDTRKWYEHIGIFFSSPKITVYIPSGEYALLSVKGDTGDVEIPNAFNFDSIDISVSTGDIKNYACASDNIKIKTTTGDIKTEDISTGTLWLSVSTGDITVSNITCEGDVNIQVSTGDARLDDISCKSVISSGSTGDISLKNVISTEKYSIERSTGDVQLDRCDAAEIYIKTDTGDVRGTLLSEKIFIVATDTGRVNVPKTITGGRCEITTDTGDIRIKIEQ